MDARNLLTNRKISIKKKWDFLNNLNDKDSDNVADLYRFFMQKSFKDISLEERPHNKYWKLAFDELMNTTAKYFSRSYKPYALFKLCRDNSMPQEYKKLIYEKHRKYYLNYIGMGSLEFTRHMMHFYPYLIEEDIQEIIKDMINCNNPSKHIDNFIRENHVLDEETLMQIDGQIVMRELCKSK
jgi:hypothetical protein